MVVLPNSQIVATSQQTRFHINDDAALSNVHVAGIDLALLSSATQSDQSPTTTSLKRSQKQTTNEFEILSNTELKLNRATCYGLIGRNGFGKSTLLRALSEKMIPGLPTNLKVACIQQTEELPVLATTASKQTDFKKLSVLQYSIQNDPYKIDLNEQLELLTESSVQSDNKSLARVHGYRLFLRHQAERDLAEKRNQALLRSGARGAQAKKDLLIAEAGTSNAIERVDQVPADLAAPEVQAELEQSSSVIASLQEELVAMSLTDREHNAKEILTGLGFDEASMQKPVEHLSGGWRMRCTLAMVLLQPADLLILDEPTNFLDLLGIVWLQQHIEAQKSRGDKIIMIVSHDRDFIDSTCEETIILRDKTLSYFSGNVTEYEIDLRSRIKFLTRMQESQDKETERAKKSIGNTIKHGKKTGDDKALRAAKSKAKKLEDRAGMQRSATGGRFKLNRDRPGRLDSKLAAIEIPTFEVGVSMSIPGATELRNSGALVALEDVALKFKTATLATLRNINLTVHSGDRIGIMGLNGSGKSTLIEVLTESLRPSSGTVTFHPQLKLGYYSQHAVEDLRVFGGKRTGLTALALLREDADGSMTDQDARGILGTFGLSGRTASDVPITALSGGQLVRLALARMVVNHPNLLVLDEISTHLDYHTVTALADALAVYDGAVVLVSHDRYMIKRVVEGMKDPASESDDNGTDDAEEEQGRIREVLVLKNGKLERQAGGVDGYERTIEKKLVKMGI